MCHKKGTVNEKIQALPIGEKTARNAHLTEDPKKCGDSSGGLGQA